jgi:hypothetical protein
MTCERKEESRRKKHAGGTILLILISVIEIGFMNDGAFGIFIF